MQHNGTSTQTNGSTPQHIKGTKKDTTCPLPESYSPKYVEAHWYDWWVKEGFFKPEYNDSDENFVIVIPPPNVTGYLHLGHMLTASIEDCIVRWNRMNGKSALWVPGCDHAGIATQSVFERRLMKEEGLTKYDLGRKKFLDRVWEWKNQKGGVIYQQFSKAGVSVDWDRECFTMGEKSSRAVIEAFVQLFNMGLIYRRNRLVNWSTALESAISDVEVDKLQLTGKTNLSVPGYDKKIPFGVIYHFKYKLVDSDEYLIVATTRPETMLGDTAVAVHPEDSRYSNLIGKHVLNTLVTPPRMMPVIADAFVDREFGTGCVKITPGHDETDFEVGQRHSLPIISVIDFKGYICAEGKFKGMKRFDARKAVLDTLKAEGLYVEEKPHPMNIPCCSRSNDVIEPLMLPQWFVDCSEMSARAIKAVKEGELNIIPTQFKETWYHWLSSGRDWCISRQLWWGHQVPAYRVFISGENPSEDKDGFWVVGRTQEEALEIAKIKFPGMDERISLERDEDVLDTWFSSAVFPFSVMGWPENTTDMQKYYPTSLLETGSDILFFWVARMVMMSLTLLNQLPFHQIYFHSIIRDAQGRKMSKSLGNVIDPLDVINGITLEGLNEQLKNGNLPEREFNTALEGQKKNFPNGIPECGTDALRFALCAYTQQGTDINLDISRIQGYRFFCNKIWNAMKLTFSFIGGTQTDLSTVVDKMAKFDHWILDRLARAVTDCNLGFETYNFSKVTDACYRFWYNDYCDIYLEDIKVHLRNPSSPRLPAIQSVAQHCVRNALLLLAPFMPYIVEELYQRLPLLPNAPPSSCVTSYPKTSEFSSYLNDEVAGQVESAIEFVRAARSLKSCFTDIKRGMGTVYAVCLDGGNLFEELSDDIMSLISCEKFEVVKKCPDGCVARFIKTGLSVALLVQGEIDVNKEKSKLEKRLAKTNQLLTSSMKSTQIENYERCVPAHIREQTSQKIVSLSETISELRESIQHLSLLT